MNRIILLFMLSAFVLSAKEIVFGEKEWERYKNIGKTVWKDGILTAEINGADPFMIAVPLKEKVKASDIKCIAFDMSVPPQKPMKGQFFWKNDKFNAFVSQCYVIFDLKAPDKWQSYELDLSRHANFNGNILQLRFDPVSYPKVPTVFKLKNFRIVLKDAADNKFTVSLPAKPMPSEATAAEELENYLGKIIKNKFVIEGKTIKKIALNQNKKRNLDTEEWEIFNDGETLNINGGERGVLYGVYHFLEDFCGVHWWTPYEETVPEKSDIVLDKIKVSGKPAFFYRDIYRTDEKVDNGRFFARNRLNRSGVYPMSVAYGGSVTYGSPNHCHTFRLYLPSDKYKDHPEYFAMVNGKRKLFKRSQLCMTNPEVRKIMLDKLRAYIKSDIAKAKEKGLSAPALYEISMNDDHSFCSCPPCKEAYTKYGHSGNLLNFVNYLAEAIEKEYPYIYLTTLAYFYNEPAPLGGVRARKNVIPKFCDTSTNQTGCITAPENRTYLNALKSWAKSTDTLFIWDYDITYNVNSYFPFPGEFHYQKLFKTYHDNKVGGIFWEHENGANADMYALKIWLKAKLMENPDADFKKLLDTFYNGYYGAAGKYIRRYRELLNNAAIRNKAYISWFSVPDDFRYVDLKAVINCRAVLDIAEQKVKGDKELLRRVRRAGMGIDVVTGRFFGDYEAEWQKQNPGKKFPLTRQSIIKRLQSLKNDPVYKALDRVIEQECNFIANLPGKVSVPEEFKGRDIMAFHCATMVPYDKNMRVVKDKDAIDGAAIMAEVPKKSGYELPFESGIYNLQTAETVCKTLNLKDIPKDNKYHWIKIGEANLNKYSYVYVSRAWTFQARLEHLRTRQFRAAAYVHVKFEGPEFGTQSADGKSRIYVDRIVIEKLK
ncbi:MAG: DUF4838 domain-containing protein [Lentisphaeria bacterium]|nr:DUF4838 domain-containing protein [Lentisphaeria bacterium]